MQTFEAIDPALRFTRNDPADPRLGELIKPTVSEGVAILGYPDDEGVRINGGREGAKDGPFEIRKQLYRMTPHPHRPIKSFTDAGNLKITGDIESRHNSGLAAVEAHLNRGLQVMSFGGGNDYAFADGMGFLRAVPSGRPLIINVDAHFDVRDTSRGLSSGTPFYRLLESEFEFDFAEIGIQTHCNSKQHWDYVQDKGGKILTVEEWLESQLSLVEYASQKLGDWLLKKRPTFLAVDMDVFSYPFAAGTSASWPIGLPPHDFMPLYNLLLKRMDVKVLGFYEVAPRLDSGLCTAKLAAQLAHGFLHHA